MVAGGDLIERALRFGASYNSSMGARMARGMGRSIARSADFAGRHPYSVGLGVAALGFGVGATKGLGRDAVGYARNSFWGQNAGPIARSTAAAHIAGYGSGRMGQTLRSMR